MVPHLRTALKGALSDLELKMMDATPMIERWFWRLSSGISNRFLASGQYFSTAAIAA